MGIENVTEGHLMNGKLTNPPCLCSVMAQCSIEIFKHLITPGIREKFSCSPLDG